MISFNGDFNIRFGKYHGSHFELGSGRQADWEPITSDDIIFEPPGMASPATPWRVVFTAHSGRYFIDILTDWQDAYEAGLKITVDGVIFFDARGSNYKIYNWAIKAERSAIQIASDAGDRLSCSCSSELPQLHGDCRTVLKSALTQLWCNVMAR